MPFSASRGRTFGAPQRSDRSGFFEDRLHPGVRLEALVLPDADRRERTEQLGILALCGLILDEVVDGLEEAGVVCVNRSKRYARDVDELVGWRVLGLFQWVDLEPLFEAPDGPLRGAFDHRRAEHGQNPECA